MSKVTDQRYTLDGTSYRVLAIDLPEGGILLSAPDFHWSDAGYGRHGISEEWLRSRLAQHKVRAGDRKNLACVLVTMLEDHLLRRE